MGRKHASKVDQVCSEDMVLMMYDARKADEDVLLENEGGYVVVMNRDKGHNVAN